MKIRTSVIVAIVLGATSIWFFSERASTDANKAEESLSGVASTKQPSMTPRNMSSIVSNRMAHDPHLQAEIKKERARFDEMEKLGHYPPHPNYKDALIAQHTTWWGRPMDPKTFWSNRVVWCDRSAIDAAHGSGRQWPPIPGHNYSDELKVPPDRSHLNAITPNNPGPFYVDNNTDDRFWEHFITTHPLPPDNILYQQQLVFTGGRPSATNLPPEALTTNALFWADIEDRRIVYQREHNPLSGAVFNFHGPVDLITNSLTADQEVQMNAWKYDYVERLKRENCDPMYVNAYIDQWQMTNAAEWSRVSTNK